MHKTLISSAPVQLKRIALVIHRDRPAWSVSFGYSQNNANQQPTSGNNYIFLEAKWQFAWVTSLI